MNHKEEKTAASDISSVQEKGIVYKPTFPGPPPHGGQASLLLFIFFFGTSFLKVTRARARVSEILCTHNGGIVSHPDGVVVNRVGKVRKNLLKVSHIFAEHHQGDGQCEIGRGHHNTEYHVLHQVKPLLVMKHSRFP